MIFPMAPTCLGFDPSVARVLDQDLFDEFLDEWCLKNTQHIYVQEFGRRSDLMLPEQEIIFRMRKCIIYAEISLDAPLPCSFLEILPKMLQAGAKLQEISFQLRVYHDQDDGSGLLEWSILTELQQFCDHRPDVRIDGWLEIQSGGILLDPPVSHWLWMSSQE